MILSAWIMYAVTFAWGAALVFGLRRFGDKAHHLWWLTPFVLVGWWWVTVDACNRTTCL